MDRPLEVEHRGLRGPDHPGAGPIEVCDEGDERREEDRQREAEQALRVKMAGDASFGDPWADIARATTIERGLYLPYLFLEGAGGFNSATFRYARTLVRAAA